jgi:antitoxin PrlF
MQTASQVRATEVKEITASVTQRGQVTVPAEVRRLLRLKPRGKLTFAIDGDEVRLLPARFTLESAFGSVAPLSQPDDHDERIRAAMEEHAEEVTREARSS